MKLIAADEVSRDFVTADGVIRALSPVSVSVSPGEFLVIAGPSGAGKSTLLNVLCGFQRPSTGTVSFRGQNLHSLGDGMQSALRNRNFGFVFQTPHMLEHKNVFQNIVLPGRYTTGWRESEVDRRARSLMEYCGIASLADRMPNLLSGGELQRVAFARALLLKPEVIFADEPTGNLDEDNSRRLLEMLKEQTADGVVVVMVTHDPRAIRYGTRILELTNAH